jgi:hypothetical protein
VTSLDKVFMLISAPDLRFHLLSGHLLQQDTNGYYRCYYDRDAEGVLKCFSKFSIFWPIYRDAKCIGSHFRFLIKQQTKESIPLIDAIHGSDITYEWHRLGFFMCWLP